MGKFWGKKMNVVDYIATGIVLVGAFNWGLIGFINFNLVEKLLGMMPLLVRVIYGVVGMSFAYVVVRFVHRWVVK
jgi:hypothetical protein